MKSKIEYGLQGAFKVDLFSGGKLVDTTDFFNNFITVSGLLYPTIYSFADCFRFLSLGNGGDTDNYGGYSENPTTGLANPIIEYTTSNGGQSGQYIGWHGYETGSEGGGASACGTRVGLEGVRFFRGWSIPTGGGDSTIQEPSQVGGLFINEFMVSPSSGENPTGRYAFSRVKRNLFIPNGHQAIITYQLMVKIQNTGRTHFDKETFDTGNAETTYDAPLIQTWNDLSGYYRQVYHGLRCVDSIGATFIPKFGDGMEPSCKNLSNLTFYFSPDNSQFNSNPTGGFLADETSSYHSDGLMGIVGGQDGLDFLTSDYNLEDLENAYYNENPMLSSLPEGDFFSNIRLGANGTSFPKLKVPSLENYSLYYPTGDGFNTFNYQVRQNPENLNLSYATPGLSGWANNLENYGKRAVFSTKTTQLPLNVANNPITSRNKTLTRKSFFSPVSSLGYNTRFGSLVYAYRTNDGVAGTRNYYPIIDCIFYDSSGRSLMKHYRLISGIQMTNRGKGLAKGYINIKRFNDGDTSESIQRFKSQPLFFGPIANGQIDREHPIIKSDDDSTNPPTLTGILFEGDYSDADGNGNTSPRGWGAVYGLTSNEYTGFPFDCGLIDHTTGSLVKPSPTDNIYWPDIQDGNRYVLEFTGLEYHCPQDGNSYPASSFDNDCANQNNTMVNLGYEAPLGQFVHYDFIGTTGGRLLPNHGIPNNQNINYYLPETGGEYPALSMDNGMEVFLDITWTSPCGNGTRGCDVPSPPSLNTISISNNSISVFFSHPDVSNIESFKVWRKVEENVSEEDAETAALYEEYDLISSVGTSPYLDGGLENSSRYSYKFQSIGFNALPYEGRASDFSNKVTALNL